MVDGLCPKATSAAAPLAPQASLVLVFCEHPTTPRLVDPNKGPSIEKHGTTVNPAMLTGDSARFAKWLSFDFITHTF